jgi:hypothetical protein
MTICPKPGVKALATSTAGISLEARAKASPVKMTK